MWYEGKQITEAKNLNEELLKLKGELSNKEAKIT